MNAPVCPMCQAEAQLYFDKPKHLFFECTQCKGIFRPEFTYLDVAAEQKHYEKHNNDVNDAGYQNFVSPIVNAVLNDFTSTHLGLDFGCGTGPVVSKMLTDAGYNIKQYDLFFAPDKAVFNSQYHYISCCEVMEHFKEPLKEFTLLKSLLLPNGKLYCKTNVFINQKPFEDWYYKNDPTHIFIYQPETLHYLVEKLGFKQVEIFENLLVFSN